MKNLLVLIFIVSIPALLFLAHDLYIFYEAQGKPVNADMVTKIASEDRPAKAFDFTSVGYLLNRYSPELHQSLKDSMDTDDLENFNLFLTFKAFYLCAAFTLVISALGMIVVLFQSVTKKAASSAQRRKSRRH